jgi:hypothetical protein
MDFMRKDLPRGAWIIPCVVIAVVFSWMWWDSTAPQRAAAHQEAEDSRRMQLLNDQLSISQEDIARYSAEVEARSHIQISDVSWSEDRGYATVRAVLRNNSQLTIEYWRATYEFQDKDGVVLHTDWTNSSTVLRPSAVERFDDSCPVVPGAERVDIRLEEVRFRQD